MSLTYLTFDIISALLMDLLGKNQPKKKKSGQVYFEWPFRFLIRTFASENSVTEVRKIPYFGLV